MKRAAVIVLTAICVQTAGAQATRDSIAVARALDAVRLFQSVWERQWISGLSSQQRRLYKINRPMEEWSAATDVRGDPRSADITCSWEFGPMRISDHAWGINPKERRIGSKGNNVHWVCPNWLPPKDYYLSGPDLGDERVWIDNALEPANRGTVAAERRALIQQLRSTLAQAPGDSVLVGQYVRMLVDNREYAAAISATENCSSKPEWCAGLKGYVQHKLGNIADADDAFRASINAQTPEQQCAFMRVGALLEEDARKAYEKQSCTQQNATNQTVWWLADPLWSVPGNDRLTEQYARKITVALHSALGRDERYNWSYIGGGDALAEMIERYGWMSYANASGRPISISFPPVQPNAYGGTPKDLKQKMAARALRGYRTSFEYSIGRVHVVPKTSMVLDPFSITNDDWSINAPSGTRWQHTLDWWPEEHYAPLHPLIKLREQQTGYLRRQTNTLFAYSTALANTDIDRRLGDSVAGAIVVSTGPASINTAERRQVGAQDRLTFLTALPAAPVLISVEVPWGPKGERGARSRFAVTAPPPLSALKSGELAMSDPLILSVPGGTTALPNFADSAVALMHGSTTLAAGSNEIGVYWETYGIAAGDSVEITVSVQRKGTGVVDRVTSVVGALSSSNSLVTASWTEPQPGQLVRNVPGAVPIQMRSVVLNITALPLGTYSLEISVKKPGSDTLRSSREFTIR